MKITSDRKEKRKINIAIAIQEKLTFGFKKKKILGLPI